MKVIAIEEHFSSPPLRRPGAVRAVAENPLLAGVQAKLDELGQGRLEDMDAGGVDVQVLSHTVPGPESLEPSQAVLAAQQVNDRLGEAVRAHPDRFAGLAVLPMSDPIAAAHELRRSVTSLGLRGAMVNGLVRGRFLDDPAFRVVFEQAQELGVPVYLHPALPPPSVADAYFRDLPEVLGDHLATAAWGWHSETALHLLRIILAGTFDRFPTLQVVVGHLGEMLPYALSRIDKVLTPVATHLQRPIAEYFQTNIWITSSGYTAYEPLQCALSVLGADRIMFAVDYPFTPIPPARALLDAAQLSQPDRDKIAHANAERLLAL